TRKVYVSDAFGFVRYLEIVHNPLTYEAAYSVELYGKILDHSELLHYTVEGLQGEFDTTDDYILIVRESPSKDLAHIIDGVGGVEPTSAVFSGTNLDIEFTYDLTLLPNETQIIMHFGILSNGFVSVDPQITRLTNGDADAVRGMTADEMLKVVNYDLRSRLPSQLNSANWNTTDSNAIVVNTATDASSSPHSVHLTTSKSDNFVMAELRSTPRDLSNVQTAELAYSFRQEDTGASDLTVEYRNDSGAWKSLHVQSNPSTRLPHFESKRIPLPIDALASNFEFRFVGKGWWIDDVALVDLQNQPADEVSIARTLGKPVTFRDGIAVLHDEFYASELASITMLDASGRSTYDLTGLEHLVNMVTLNLSDNLLDSQDLANLLPRRLTSGIQASEIVGMPHLRELDLSNNPRITDISTLASLTELRSLNLEGTSVDPLAQSTIDTINSLIHLEFLKLPTTTFAGSQDLIYDEGESVSFTSPVSGTWRVRDEQQQSIPIQGNDTNRVSFTPNDDGQYTIDRGHSGFDNFETGDFSLLPWVNESNSPWVISGDVVNGGSFSARSGDIGDDENSQLSLTVTVPIDGDISFSHRVSSEFDYDFLRFSIDGNELAKWSGEPAVFTAESYPIIAGQHTFEWKYTKDGSEDSGLDAAFIDDIRFPTDAIPVFVRNVAPTIDLVPVFETTEGIPVIGEGQVVTVADPTPGDGQFQFSIDGTPMVDNLVVKDRGMSDLADIRLRIEITDPDGVVSDITRAALRFDNGVLRMPNSILDQTTTLRHPVLHGQSDITTTFWLTTQKSELQTILSATNAGSGTEFSIDLSATALSIESGNQLTASWPITVTDNVRRHFAIVRDQQNGRVELFVNGDTQGTRAIVLEDLVIAADGLVVGQKQGAVGGSFSQGLVGTIDDLTFWNRVLTATEIDEIEGGEVSASDSNLLAYWPMNEGSGEVARDRSGNRNDALFESFSSYANTVLADQPVAYYRLGESSGATAAIDSSIHGRAHGTYDGVALGQTGALSDGNSSAAFDGTSASISIPLTDALKSTSFTVEFWARVGGGAGTERTAIDALENRGYAISVSASNEWQLRTQEFAAPIATLSGPVVAENEWTHVVAMFDPSSNIIGTASLYIDGQLTASAETDLSFGDSTSLFIGQNRFGIPKDYFNGNLDEVSIYDRALSAVEVQSHFDSGKDLNRGPIWDDHEFVSFTPVDEGDYKISVTVSDEDGGFDTFETVFEIANVAPVINSLNTRFAEGKTAAEVDSKIFFDAKSVADPGELDKLSYLWEVTTNNGQVIPTSDSIEFSFTPKYSGEYTVSLTVTDSDGDSSVATTQTFLVDPTSRIGGPDSGSIGVPMELTSADSSPPAPAGPLRGTAQSVHRQYLWESDVPGIWANSDPAIMATAPVAAYRFEELAGTTASNLGSQGASSNGTLRNGLTLGTPGIDGNAVSFDGVDDYIEIPRTIADNFTISLWLKSNQASKAGGQWNEGWGLVDGDVAGEAHDFGLSILNGKFAFGIGSDNTTIESTTTINDGLWHHVVATRDGESGEINIFVDGRAEDFSTGPIGSKAAANRLTIGMLQTGLNYFQGQIDELGIYDRILEREEVAAIYLETADRPNAVFVPVSSGPHTLSLTVTDIFTTEGRDRLQLSHIDSLPVQVDEVTIALNATATEVFEGEVVAYTVDSLPSIHEIGGTRQFQWEVKDQSDQIVSNASGATYAFTPLDQDTYRVKVTVTDTFGPNSIDRTEMKELSVLNVAPTLDINDVEGTENAPISISAIIHDAGLNDTHTYSIDWGTEVENGDATRLPEVVYPIAHYRFEEESNSVPVANDGSVGAAATGTYDGVTVGTAGIAHIGGNAAQFNGTSDRVTTALNLDQSATGTGATIEAWVYPTSASGNHVVVSTGIGANWQINYIGDRWYLNSGIGAVDTGLRVDANQWQHIAAVFDPSTDSVRFYKNGEQSAPIQTALGYTDEDENVTIGSRSVPGAFYEGKIDEVAIFDQPLSTEQIQEHFNATNSLSATNAELRPAGVFSGTHLFPQNGTYLVTVTVNDGDGGMAEQEIRVVIGNVAPEASDDIGAVLEDAPLEIQTDLLLNNDSDIGPDTLTVSYVDELSAEGVPITLANGIVTYDPRSELDWLPEGVTIVDTFDYIVTDGNGGTDSATMSITVTGANDSPLSSPETFIVVEGSPSHASGNVLVNDSDADIGSPIDRQDQGLRFDGENDYLELPEMTADFSSGLTFEFWAYPTALVNSASLIHLRGVDHGVHLSTTSNGNLSLSHQDGMDQQFGILYLNPVEVNRWQHFAVTVATDSAKVYKDGILVAEVAGPHPLPDDDMWTENTIGHISNYNHFQGRLDDVRIWNRALTLEEVEASILDGPDEQSTNLVANWEFSDGTGTIATDTSGNEYHATLIGAPTWASRWPTSGDSVEVVSIDAVTAGDVTGQYGVLSWDRNGEVEYRLNNEHPDVERLAVGELLTESFTYTIRDDSPSAAVANADLSITIRGTNDRPQPMADSNSTSANATLLVTADYSDAVRADQPVGYWRLGDSSSVAENTRAPFSPNGAYRGTITTGADGLIASDGDNKAVQLSTDGFVSIPESHQITRSTSEKTIELWFKADAVDDRQVLYEQGDSSNGFNVYLDAGQIYFGAWNTQPGDSSHDFTSFISQSVEAGTAYHVAAVFHHRQLHLYLNGVSVATAEPNQLSNSINGHAGNATIGAFQSSTLFHDGPDTTDDNPAEAFFNGVIDELVIYKTAFNSRTVDAHLQAAATLGNERTGLLANDFNVDHGDTRRVHAVNGQSDSIGRQITLDSGALLQVSGDGGYTYDPNSRFDYLAAAATTTDTFRYTIIDAYGATDTAIVTVTITGTDEPPTNIELSNLTVAENRLGAVVGQVVVSDPDVGQTHAFTISDARFEIAGGQLKLKDDVFLNYESTQGITLDVITGAFSATFTLRVLDSNDAPTDITVVAPALSVAENAAGSVISQLLVVDVDVVDDHSFAVDDSRFEIVNGFLKLKSDQSLDFEDSAGSSIELNITVTDNGGLSTNAALTVSVTNVNESPTQVTLDNNSVVENRLGAVIGTLNVTDPDTNDTHTLSVNDSRFEIVNNQLKLKDSEVLNFDDGEVITLTVVAVDAAQLQYEQSLDIAVLAVESLLTLDVTTGNGSDDLTLRRNGANLEIYDNNANASVASLPLADTRQVVITGAVDEDDRLTVDFDFGGFFTVAEGVHFHGADGGADTLVVVGTGVTTGKYEPSSEVSGSGTVDVRESGSLTQIKFTGLEPVVVSKMRGFELETPGSLDSLTLSPRGGGDTLLISGASDGLAFESLEVGETNELLIDTATNDRVGDDNDTLTFAGDFAPNGIDSITIATGSGTDSLALESFQLTIPDLVRLRGENLTVSVSGGGIVTGEIDFGGSDIDGFGRLDAVIKDAESITVTGGVLDLGNGTVGAFNFNGALDVGDSEIVIRDGGFANLGSLTTIEDGIVRAANGIALSQGDNLIGSGIVAGRFAADAGSVITANGDLTLGDIGSLSGFFSDGELNVNQHAVTILDRDIAVLGTLTNIGTADADGSLSATNGLLLEAGKTLFGRGAIHNDFNNQGHVIGREAPSELDFIGLVSGSGDFDGNVVFSGTFSPGNSPALIQFGSDATFRASSTLLVELGGLQAGSQFDRMEIAGTANLDGTIRIALINSFVPQIGDELEILTFGQRVGDFATYIGLNISPTVRLVPEVTDTHILLRAVPNAGVVQGDIVDVTPDPRNSDAGLVSIHFDNDVTGFDLGDLSLTLDGQSVDLTGLAVNGTGRDYTVDLSTVTATPGAYVLTLVANGSGIEDLSGGLLINDASDSWTADTTTPTAAEIVVAPTPRNVPVGSIAVEFSESVSGFTIDDLTLTIDGQPVDVSGLVVTGADTSYSLDLTGVTGAEGDYVLTMNTAGVTDLAGNTLAAAISTNWTMDTSAPTAGIVNIAPDPRDSAVSTVEINFSEAIVGFDIDDLSLTRNAVAVDISGLTIVGTDANYTIDLSSVTGVEGVYELTLAAAAVSDLAGNTLAVGATDDWVFDATSPTADIVDVDPDPRDAVVSSISIVFDEAVTGVTIDDFSLTLDGQPVDISGLTVEDSGTTYTIGLAALTNVAGLYELRLNAVGSDIQDLTGHALINDASDTWTFVAPEFIRLISPISLNAAEVDPADLPKGNQPTSWDQQRSMIRTVDLEFNIAVTPTPSDFRLTNLGIRADVDPDSIVPITFANIVVDNNKVSLLFDDGLPEGVYQLEVLSTLADAAGIEFDGNGDGTPGDSHLFKANSTNRFYTLEAEWNGDTGVSVFDFSSFSYWFGIPVPRAPLYVDLNRDGGVSVFDFSHFSDNFGIGIGYPTNFADGTPLVAGATELALQDVQIARRSTPDQRREAENQVEIDDDVMMELANQWQQNAGDNIWDEQFDFAPNDDGEQELDGELDLDWLDE
ncbi:MAG: VCBS repeat-containing protein, partial [Pirellulaceae bacterium]